MSRLWDGHGDGRGWRWQLWVPTVPWRIHMAHTSPDSAISVKGSASNRGAGAEQRLLVCQEEGKKMLVVVKSQSSTHHLRWKQGPEIPPTAAEGLTQPHSGGDVALSSWVLVC